MKEKAKLGATKRLALTVNRDPVLTKRCNPKGRKWPKEEEGGSLLVEPVGHITRHLLRKILEIHRALRGIVAP